MTDLAHLTPAELRRLRAVVGESARARIDEALRRRRRRKEKSAPPLAWASRRPHTGGPLRLVIEGAPRTKKTSNQLVWAPKKKRRVIVPSAAHEAWVAAVLPQLEDAPRMPNRPLNCRALIYRDRRTGDAVGYYQGLADLLQAAGVVSDDKWIETWDGSRLLVDRERPRVEVELDVRNQGTGGNEQW